MNEKKISISTMLLIIAIIIIGIMAYFLYDINLQKETIQGELNHLANEIDETEDEETVIQKENSFEVYQENYKNSFKQFMEEHNEISIFLGEERKYELPGVVEVYVDSKNDAYFRLDKNSELYSKYGETYKVESGVANIFVCPDGTGGYSEAIFLKLDGTASCVGGYALEQNPVIECKKIEGVENAVNVISYTYIEYNELGEIGADGPATVFIDINGSVIK